MTDSLRLGLEWFLNPDHVPFLLAEEKGWLREEGLALELVEPSEHLDAMAEIERGTMDVAITEPLHLVEDRARGRDAIGFARFLHTQGGVMTLKRSGIERPRDMIGKRIQYPGAPGPGGPAIVATMIEADGGTADVAAFGRVNHGFKHTDALAEGLADVATLVFWNFEGVEATVRGLEPRLFPLEHWGVPDFCQLVLCTSERTLAARRPVFERLLRVVRRGVDLVKRDPAEARRVYLARTGTSPDDALMSAILDATLPCFTRDLSMSPAYYTQLARWMRARGLVDRDVTPSELWTDALVFG
jgi:ABC-type nitrate/sulfonate/bicarbonate transport system substrate-binding protein